MLHHATKSSGEQPELICPIIDGETFHGFAEST